MEEIRRAMEQNGAEPLGPDSDVCGPSGDAWTMPLPGEWLRFPTPD